MKSFGILIASFGLGACGAAAAPAASSKSDTPDDDQIYAAEASAPEASPEAGVDAGRDASGSLDAGSDSGPVDPLPICGTIALGQPQPLLDVETAGSGLSMSADALSAAWTTSDGNGVTIHYVDRASAGASFESERTITGAFADGRVALAEDGLGLAVVQSDGLGLQWFSRDSRADAFVSNAGPFANVNAHGTDDLGPAGERFGDPIFARDGHYVLFSRFTPGADSSVELGTAIFPGDPYSSGQPFGGSAFVGKNGVRHVVTGVSADLRTWFVTSSDTNTTTVTNFDASGNATTSYPLPGVTDLQVSTDCSTAYGISDGKLVVYRF